MNPLLRLYPREWRERYGDEMSEILTDRTPGPSLVLDVVLGALDARKREHMTRGRVEEASMMTSIRSIHPLALLLMGVVAIGVAYGLVVSVGAATAPDPDRWAGWGPVGFASGCVLVLLGLGVSLRRPIAGLVLGVVGATMGALAAYWLWPFALLAVTATALPWLSQRMRSPASEPG
jgi:hypothetical protein